MKFNMDDFNAGMDKLIPAHMHQGMTNYIVHHVLPGSFLVAALSGNLELARRKADGVNLQALDNYMEFFRDYLDDEMHGTTDKIIAWIAAR